MTHSNGVHIADVLQTLDSLDDDQKREALKFLLAEVGVPVQINLQNSGTNIFLVAQNSAEIAPLVQAAAERVRREQGRGGDHPS